MKWLLIGFIFIQLGVDLAHSVTAFPFVHYGMFSESFAAPDSLAVFEITVNGHRLQAGDFRIYRWDMIQTPLTAIELQQSTHDFALDRQMTDMGLSHLGAGRLFTAIAPQLDNDSSVATRFPGWYKFYLSGLLGHSIQTLRVDKAWYRYSGGRLLLLKKENRINS